MKIIILNILLVFIVQLSNCSKGIKNKNKIFNEFGTCHNDLKTTSVIEKGKGKIIKVSDELWAIVPEGQENMRYGICQIPEVLKIDNLEVIYSGDIKEITPNVRYAASPFVLKELEVIDK